MLQGGPDPPPPTWKMKIYRKYASDPPHWKTIILRTLLENCFGSANAFVPFSNVSKVVKRIVHEHEYPIKRKP